MRKQFNPLIENLIEIFSYNEVFAPNNEKCILNLQNIIRIYEIINKHAFSSKLEIPDFYITNEFIGSEHLAAYNYRFITLKDTSTFILITKPTKIKTGLLLMPPSILLNPILTKGITLMLFVNILTHEMIHQDDVVNGSLLQRKYNAKLKDPRKSFNPHIGYFNNFANKLNNEFGLDIKEVGSTMDKESQLSIEAVRKLLLEEENIKALHDLNENEFLDLSDIEKIKRFKVGLEKDKFANCKYIGNGIFEEILF